MFYSSTDGQYIYDGQQFTIGGITYPSNWLNNSTAEEKAAIGLEEVVATNAPADQTYYWVTPEYNGASLTYVNTPKDLTSVKTNAINTVNNTAYSLLLPSDWMVVKAVETSTTVPNAWNTWRASIRTTATSTVSAIEAASDVPAVQTIMGNIAWAADPDQVAAQLAAEAEAAPTKKASK